MFVICVDVKVTKHLYVIVVVISSLTSAIVQKMKWLITMILSAHALYVQISKVY